MGYNPQGPFEPIPLSNGLFDVDTSSPGPATLYTLLAESSVALF